MSDEYEDKEVRKELVELYEFLVPEDRAGGYDTQPLFLLAGISSRLLKG